MTCVGVLVVLASAQRRGAEIQGADLAAQLAQRGYRARAVALAPGGEHALDVEVLDWRALRAAMRSQVVVAHGSTALPAVAVASLAQRTRWVYRSIGDPGAWVRGPLHRARTAAQLARADRVVTLWDGASQTMHRLYGVRHRRLRVIPNHRSPEAFPPVTAPEREAARRRLGVEGAVVVYLGALTEEKQPLDAVRAVAPLDDVTLLVAGAGPLAPAVADLGARVAAGRVRLVGETADPAGLLAAADALVLPSRTEGMPGVVIEAQLRGIPVVATAVGAVPSMVLSGVDGAVVAPGDPAAMTQGLRDVLAEPDRFRGAAEARACARYGVAAVVSAWERLIAELAR